MRLQRGSAPRARLPHHKHRERRRLARDAAIDVAKRKALARVVAVLTRGGPADQSAITLDGSKPEASASVASIASATSTFSGGDSRPRSA